MYIHTTAEKLTGQQYDASSNISRWLQTFKDSKGQPVSPRLLGVFPGKADLKQASREKQN